MKCKKCGYEWQNRVPNPKQCPACKNPLKKSKKPKPDTNCKFCNHKWKKRVNSPKQCPSCHRYLR